MYATARFRYSNPRARRISLLRTIPRALRDDRTAPGQFRMCFDDKNKVNTTVNPAFLVRRLKSSSFCMPIGTLSARGAGYS